MEETVSVLAAVTRARKLHSPIKARYQRTHDGGPEDLCLECGASWPCATYDSLEVTGIGDEQHYWYDVATQAKDQRDAALKELANVKKMYDLACEDIQEYSDVISKVRKYADERSVYAKTKNNTVGSWRIASDLHEIVGDNND